MATFERKTEKTSYKDLERNYQTGYYTDLNESIDSKLPEDYSTPFSFNQWIQTQDAVEPNSQYEFYLRYITQWYKSRFTSVEVREIVKTNYISLLKQLNIVFKDEINEKWFTALTYDTDLDIQDMIEFYSKKLKQIAYFLAEKRESVKSTKLKYNTVGSNFGVAKLFTDYVLRAFTQRPYAYNVPTNDIIQKFPALSAINTSFQITVQELFDESNYYDHNSNLSTMYYNSTSEDTIASLTSIGLQASDAEWVYDLGRYETVTEAASTETLSLSDYGNLSDETLISDLLVGLTEKYLGSTLYDISITNTEYGSITATYDLVQGNNWFYWPSGEFIFEADNLQINDIALSATSLLDNGADSIATAGLSYLESDRIFVHDYRGVTAAWAKSLKGGTIYETMSAMVMGQDHLLFKYPYPGYGVASDTLPWTGKTYENITGIYRYLDKSTKKVIESYYFSDTAVEAVHVEPIKLNETTLISNGASPGKQYADADQIVFTTASDADRVHDSAPNTVYNDNYDHVWLYDVTRTNLAVNTGKTNILWPLQTYKGTPDDTYITPDDYCTSIPLSALDHSNFIGARSGHGMYDADIVYILDGINGATVGAAWLYSGEIKHALQNSHSEFHHTQFSNEISGSHQPGLYMQCFPGQYATFVWADSSIDINDTTITYHKIPIDSTYRTIDHFSIYETRLKTLQDVYFESEINTQIGFEDFGLGAGIGDWKTDESRSILFSPIGHPGSEYEDYDKMADIIFVDTSFPEPFSLATWIGTDGYDFRTSKDFAWFKLDGTQLMQPDVGWGPGSWVNADGTTSFILSAGQQYKYLRANLRRSAAEVQMHAVPYMTIKQPYAIANTRWIKTNYNGSIFEEDPNYLDTDIVLRPGSVLVYDHYDTTSYCVTSEDTRGISTTTEYSKVCSTDFKAWIDYNILETGQIFTAAWPAVLFYESITTGPAPLSGARSYDSVTWTITSEGAESKMDKLPPTSLLVFKVSANDICEYTVQATASAFDGRSETYNLKVSAIPVTSRESLTGALIYETIQNQTIPVEICVPLSGWDIDLGVVDNNSPHATPIWVTATDEDSAATKNKGVPISDRAYSFEHEIILKQQPMLASIILDTYTVMDYKRSVYRPLTWVQPVQYNNETSTYKWKKLLLGTTTNPLTSFTCETFETQTVSATDIDSDIIFETPDDTGLRRQYINYFAMNDINWVQRLSLKRIAPSTTTMTASAVLTPEFELLNMLNRHDPTVASVPRIDNLISKDAIGIFTPDNLGLPTYLGKSHITEIRATSGSYTNILDADIFESDFGFTKELNISPVIRKDYNAIWMKTPATFIAKSGTITDSKPYEKFNPYQNKYEIINHNSAGVNYTTDVSDPWSGQKDSNWRPTSPLTTDFRGVNNTQLWLSTFATPVTSQVYNWGTDLYGNNYALVKPLNGYTPYEQYFVDGEIWVRTIDNELSRATSSLQDIFLDFQSTESIYNDIIEGKVWQLVVIEDKLIVCTKDGIGISRVVYNYTNQQITTSRNEYAVFDYSTVSTPASGALLGRVLQIVENRTVLFPITISSEYGVELVEYELSTNRIRRCFELSSSINELSTYLSDNALDELTVPVITYNPNTKQYNMSFLARNTVFAGDYLISITFELIEGTYTVKKIDKLTP